MRLQTLGMQLNTFYSGPQAWFFLAEERGYLRDEGLALAFTESDTSANTIPKMAGGGFDVGYGDINALIEHAAAAKPNAPLAVFSSYSASPYTLAVAASSHLRTPQQLTGKRLVAHPNDAALNLFAEFCGKTGLDARSVSIEISAAPHSELVPQLLGDRWDAMFGFVNTLVAATLDAALMPADLRFIQYHDHVPELYGMAIIVTRKLVAESPETVQRLLRALNRGLVDTVADPEAAIDALIKRNPNSARASNLRRLQGTLVLDMGRAEGAMLGIGDLDGARLQRGIDLIVNTKGFAHRPIVQELFSRNFLPPLDQRVRSLA